jgi:hypothetical protein
VVAGYLHHLTVLGNGRHTERISRSLHHEHRDRHRIELVETALRRLAAGASRRQQREREAEHADGVDCGRRAARDARARRTPADDEGQIAELARTEVVDHGDPGCIELMRRRRRPPPRDPIGLLDEHDRQSCFECGSRGGDEVLRMHTTACAVPEDERSAWRIRTVDVCVRHAERRLDL